MEFDQAFQTPHNCLGAGNWRCRRNQSYDVINEIIDDDIAHERIEDPELESLINYTSEPVTYCGSFR